jgi:predicted nucleotide-binding protein
MARKKEPPKPEIITDLAVPRAEAATRLGERIEKGKAILARDFRNLQELDEAKAEHAKWSAFNFELLKRLFTSTEPADEYIRFFGGAFPMDPTPQQRVAMFREDLADGVHRLESILERLELYREPGSGSQSADTVPKGPKGPKSRVFIVHGHDDAAKEALARFLERLKLEAIILHERATGGRTIIEKLEHYGSVDFAVVLLTPDDIGAARADAASPKPRARQNVVLELGFFIGVLGRAHVCALHKGGLELPTDFVGVGYVSMDDAGAWRFLLARELGAAGFTIDMNLVV